MSLWNGQDLGKGAPDLGFTLASAQLIPSFVEQFFASGLFTHKDDLQITPLDDVKEWMRSDPWRSGTLYEEVSDLLLGEERKARKEAQKAGVEFDIVGYELSLMDEDTSYENFNPLWASKVFALVIEEADAIQEWCKRTHVLDFALAISFELPDHRRNKILSREYIGWALAEHGAKVSVAQAVSAGQHTRLELSGAIQLDLTSPGEKGPSLERKNGVGFVRVPLADPRAGDKTIAHLCLAYPLDSEGYFLATFDALCKTLTLKPPVSEE